MHIGRPLLALAVLAAVVTTVSCQDIFSRFGFPRYEFPRINFPKIEIPPIVIPAIDPAQIQNLKPGSGRHVSGMSYVSDGSGSTLITNVDGEVKVQKTGDHAKRGADAPEIMGITPILPINIDTEELQNQKPGSRRHVSGWSYVAHSDDSGSGSTLLTNNDGEVNVYKTGDHADVE